MKNKKLLTKIEAVRVKNNAQWMRLIGLSLECDQIKSQVESILLKIKKNDVKITKLTSKLTKRAK